MSEYTKSLPAGVLIRKWIPKDNDVIADVDGKLFVMHFDKVFSNTKDINVYNRFFIKKGSYENQLIPISYYINFFIKHYDEEKELVSSYLKLKYSIDKLGIFKEEDSESLIQLVYELLFSESMINKIHRFIDENYTDDIEGSSNKKYVGKNKEYLESLEFTNEHIKILLKISFGMKIIAPILFHYAAINIMKLNKESEIIFNFYRGLFDLFTDSVDMYNKLFVYVKAKVLESKAINSPIFDQRDIFGDNEYLLINKFLREELISENIVKYLINSNIVGFNKTILKYQLMYYLKLQYSKNLTELTSAKNSDGLSGIDKLEMNMKKVDEGMVTFAEINNRMTVDYIIKEHKFTITEEEIDYYIMNHTPSKFQINLVYSYWAKYFGSYRNLYLLSRRDYIRLMLVLKKKLLVDTGCSPDEFTEQEALPYIISGNIGNKMVTRLIRNNKFIVKIDQSYLYENIVNSKYSKLHILDPDYIMGILSTIINTEFSYVVYENQEMLGKPIEYDEDTISDRLLFFINTI